MSRVERLFAALGARVTDPCRDPKYDVARIKIANGALIPSRIWDDTAVWTSSSTSRRQLLIGGRFENGRYRLEALNSVPQPSVPAASRHVINLTRLSDNEYAWDTDVAYAIGDVTAPDVATFARMLFAAAERRDERDLRAHYSAVVPQTAAVLAQLFSIDSIRTTRKADGSTLAHFVISVHPERVEKRLPHFAEYLRKYAETAKMRWTLTDGAGISYFELSAAEGTIGLRVRTQNGQLVSLTDPLRVMPDSLLLNGSTAMKVRRLTAGFYDYRADFTVVKNNHETAWLVVSRHEPEWTLPLFTERLLRTPLRRPFQGNGAMFRIGIRDSVGEQSILHRRMHLEVKESAILRFIGRLGATAVEDYQGKAEREQYVWLREVFGALVADIRALP